jgi:phosphinothricin acetyltransferase
VDESAPNRDRGHAHTVRLFGHFEGQTLRAAADPAAAAARDTGGLIRPLAADDWPVVAAIYEEGIRGGLATFETEVPSWEAWDATHLREHRLVAHEGTTVVGFAALSPVSRRLVYAGVAEDSVYVAGTARGRGVGRALLGELVVRAEHAGIWTIQAAIFPDNEASLALHRACGFRVVGVRERIARLNGVWRDIVFVERRSALVGRD